MIVAERRETGERSGAQPVTDRCRVDSREPDSGRDSVLNPVSV